MLDGVPPVPDIIFGDKDVTLIRALRDSNAGETQKPWDFTMGNPWENHGKSVGKPWENHGKAIELWEKGGFSWDSMGFTLWFHQT